MMWWVLLIAIVIFGLHASSEEEQCLAIFKSKKDEDKWIKIQKQKIKALHKKVKELKNENS